VPELAARRHIESVSAIANEALWAAGASLPDVDAFAVANGPGLAGALLVGLSYAKAVAYALNKPLVGVHHIEAHICANFLDIENESGGLIPPLLSLVASGGHTVLLAVRDYNCYEPLGSTRDDAAGEAFDKAARSLGLPYPGGPAVDELARGGDPRAVRFPIAKLGAGKDGSELDFSFSGLKTAVVQYLRKEGAEASRADVAASFQRAVADALHNLGIIHTDKLVETDRAGLVAGYVGQTAIKTTEKVMEAMDGVLFIDEAYALARGGANDFGREAVDTLVKLMDDHRGRLVVVLAGYSDSMDEFLKTNPGLKSRFPHVIEFPDYSTDELFQIAERFYSSNGYALSPIAGKKLRIILQKAITRENFGNGRYVRNVFERSVNKQALRLSADTDLTREELIVIKAEDIEEV
jgi:glycoprotease/Kae1 family metallohydrolase